MRIVILALDMPESSLIVDRFVANHGKYVVGMVRSNTLIAGKSTLGAYRFLIQRAGYQFLLQKGMEEGVCAASTLWHRLNGRRPPIQSLRRLAREYQIPIVSAKDVHQQNIRDQLVRWNPDLLVSIYVCQKIKTPILEVARTGAINFHPALLPHNRGLMPYIWALANGDLETGGTVHWIDEELDTGNVILQRSFPIRDDDTVFSLAFRSAALGGNMVVDAVHQIVTGTADSVAQNHEAASYFSWPDRECMKQLRERGRKWGSLTEMWSGLTRGEVLQPPEWNENRDA